MQRRMAGGAEGAEGPADERGGMCRGGQLALRREQRGDEFPDLAMSDTIFSLVHKRCQRKTKYLDAQRPAPVSAAGAAVWRAPLAVATGLMEKSEPPRRSLLQRPIMLHPAP